MKEKIIQNIKSIILALVLVVGVSYVSAGVWNPPTATAPGNNTETPLDASISSQTKAGGLNILGNVGIGTTNFTHTYTTNDKFRVASPDYFSQFSINRNRILNNQDASAMFFLGGNSVNADANIIYGYIKSGAANSTPGSESGSMTISTSSKTDPSVYMTLSHDRIVLEGANVRIGGTEYAASNYKLHVGGDINFTGTLRQNGTAVNLGGNQPWTTSGTDISYSTGNVGIGTTTPRGYSLTKNLEAMGTITATASTNNFTELWPDSALIWGSSSNSCPSGGCMRFGKANTPDAAGWTEFMRIDGTGKVGIGTTIPGANLDVAGTARATYLTVTPQNTGGEGGEISLAESIPFGDYRQSWQIDVVDGDIYNNSSLNRIRFHSHGAELFAVDSQGRAKFTNNVVVNGSISSSEGIPLYHCPVSVAHYTGSNPPCSGQYTFDPNYLCIMYTPGVLLETVSCPVVGYVPFKL